MHTFFVSLIMGLFGAIAVTTSSHFSWPTWVMFIAWVSYYLFGKSLKTAKMSFIQILCGILMGIAMQTTAGFLAGTLGSLSFPVTVFFFIGALAYITKIKNLNNIPAWFIGLIVFFGVHPQIDLLPILSLLPPIVAGFTFAHLNSLAINKIAKH